MIRLLFSGSVLVLTLAAGCSRSPATQPTSTPVEKPRVEATLAVTTLSPTHVAALMIETAPIVTRPVQESLQLTGWVIAPQGYEVVVTAPMGGHVLAPRKQAPLPVPGLPAHKG